jgi:hypothetical protein
MRADLDQLFAHVGESAAGKVSATDLRDFACSDMPKSYGRDRGCFSGLLGPMRLQRQCLAPHQILALTKELTAGSSGW